MNSSQTFSSDYIRNEQLLDAAMRINDSFDLVGRHLTIANKKAKLYFVDGMIKDDTMGQIFNFILKATVQELTNITTSRDFANKFIAYPETEVVSEPEKFITFVLSGSMGLIVEGFSEGIIIDARTYPVRPVAEPENDRVLRGPHEGFVETLVFNTAMLRRRIRDKNMTVNFFEIGNKSKTNVAVCYMDNLVDKKMLKTVKDKLSAININGLTMGQESLLECLIKKQRYNPFPKTRYTERPDAAAASIYEGSILIITDGTPAVMIVPTGIFSFMQDTNDYYFPPLVGTLLRLTRIFVSALTMVITPVWLFFMNNPNIIPHWLNFIRVEEPTTLPLIVQLLIVEFVISSLKIASLNTPSAMGSTFNVVAALVLGEFAVTAKWLTSEVVLYMAFVAITNFAQSSFELGYSLKISRIMLLVLVSLFDFWGLVGGLVLLIILISTTSTIAGNCYLYPLIPFKPQAMFRLMFRRSINMQNN